VRRARIWTTASPTEDRTVAHRLNGDTRLQVEPKGYPPDTILTKAQLAAALSTSEDSIERAGIPASYALGTRCPRFIWADVIQWFRNGGRAA
jgi:hypothetical protein